MAHFRRQKQEFLDICGKNTWADMLTDRLADFDAAKLAVSPLLALLPRPEARWQAAFGLGLAVARMGESSMEEARVIMRRLMWSLNEESGNLGWGIPEAMGCILGNSGSLAAEYGRILISYGYETGKDDNFLDHTPLRRGVYWGIGRMAASFPAIAMPALPHLGKALLDDDALVVGMAASAVRELVRANPATNLEQPSSSTLQEISPVLAIAKNNVGDAELEFLDGKSIRHSKVSEVIAEAEQAVELL